MRDGYQKCSQRLYKTVMEVADEGQYFEDNCVYGYLVPSNLRYGSCPESL